jgi:hypothetical protein
MNNIIGNFNSGRVIPVVKGLGYGTAFSGQQASRARNKEISSLNRLSMSMNPWLSEIADQQLNSTWLAYQENQMLKAADSGELPSVALAQLKRTLQPMEQRKQVTQETQTESIGTGSETGAQGKVGSFLSEKLMKDIRNRPVEVSEFLQAKVQELERASEIGGDVREMMEKAMGEGLFTKQKTQKEGSRRGKAFGAVEGMLQSLGGSIGMERVESILQEKGYQGIGKPSVRGGSFAQAGGGVLGSVGRLAQLQATQTQGGDSTQLSGVVPDAPLSSGDLGSVTASQSPQLPIASEAQLLQQGVMPSRLNRTRLTRRFGGAVVPIESPTNVATEVQQDITQQTYVRARNRNVGRVSRSHINISSGGGGAEAMSEENIFSEIFAGGGESAYAGGGESAYAGSDPRASIDPKVIADLPEEVMSIDEKIQRMLELYDYPDEIPGTSDLMSEELKLEFGNFLRLYPGKYPKRGETAFKAFMGMRGMQMVSAGGGRIVQGQGGLKITEQNP